MLQLLPQLFPKARVPITITKRINNTKIIAAPYPVPYPWLQPHPPGYPPYPWCSLRVEIKILDKVL